MIKNEIKRVWSKNFILLTILLLLVNGLMLLSNSPIGGVKPKQIKRAFQLIRNRDYSIEKLEVHYEDMIMNRTKTHLFSSDFIEELSISRFFYDYVGLMGRYDEYIDSIVSQKSEISIFNKAGDFSKQSSRLAAKLYSPLKDLDLKPVNFLAFEEASSYFLTDIFILIIVFYLVSVLLLEDRKNGSLDFYRTMKRGRTKYAIVKLITLSLFSVCLVLCFYALNLSISTYKYGLPDFAAPIQSSRTMITSFLKIDTLKYLVLFMVIKCVVFCLISYLLALFSFFTRSIRDFFLILVFYIGGSWFLYETINTLSTFKLLRTINIIPIMRVHPMFSQLQSINIFENAVLYHHLVYILITAGVIVSIFSVLNILKKAEIIGFSRTRRYDILSISRFINPKTTRGFELFKIGFYNRAFILSIIFLVWVVFRTYSLLNVNLDFQEQYYRNYVKSTRGKTDTEIKRMIASEMDRFNALNKEISSLVKEPKESSSTDPQTSLKITELSKQMEGRAAFDRMVRDYYRIAAINKSGQLNKTLRLEYNGGVNRLTANDYHSIRQDHITAIGLIICMIACFSSIYVSEKTSNVIDMLKVTPKGKSDVTKYKLIFAVIITSILFILAQIPQIVQAVKIYTMPSLNTPIYSFEVLRNQPLNTSLLTYLIILYSSKYIGILTCLFIIIIISSKMEDEINAIIVSFSVLILPLIIDLYGNQILRYVSLVGIVSPNIALNRHGLYAIILISEFLIISIMFNYYSVKEFFKSGS